MAKRIWLDMDGTIANLYGVKNWLGMIENEDATPYAIAEPIVNAKALAKVINSLKARGYEVAILSALAKNSSPTYDKAVKAAKLNWLKANFPSVEWNEIRFVPYSYIKNCANAGSDILFDDESRHLSAWTGKAYNAKNLLVILASLR